MLSDHACTNGCRIGGKERKGRSDYSPGQLQDPSSPFSSSSLLVFALVIIIGGLSLSLSPFPFSITFISISWSSLRIVISSPEKKNRGECWKVNWIDSFLPSTSRDDEGWKYLQVVLHFPFCHSAPLSQKDSSLSLFVLTSSRTHVPNLLFCPGSLRLTREKKLGSNNLWFSRMNGHKVIKTGGKDKKIPNHHNFNNLCHVYFFGGKKEMFEVEMNEWEARRKERRKERIWMMRGRESWVGKIVL